MTAMLPRAAAFLAIATLSSCDGCAPVVPPAVAFLVESDATSVELTLAPFAWRVVDPANGTVRGGTLAGDAPDCAPIALGLRADDDVRDWHSPHAPRGDEVWLRSTDASVVSEGPALVLDVALAAAADGPPETDARRSARVTVEPGAEGFVHVDVDFDEDELNIALVSTCLKLAPDEHIVGGGEGFAGPDLRGRVVPLAFEAPGPFASGTNEAHAPVPFFASNHGLGMLVETERVGAFDIGVTEDDAVIARFHGASLPLRLRSGTIVDNVAAHARRMGLPPPPPRWALAPMQWRNDLEVELDVDGNVVSSGVDVLLADIEQARARDIPLSTVWIDAPWQTGYNTLVFNEQQLPGIDAAIESLRARGVRVLTWATEHVNTSDDSDQAFGMPAFASRALFDAYRDAGFLVLTSTQAGAAGAPFEFPWGRGDGAFVDFTNPAACDAWRANIRPLLLRGVHGFKLDYGETMRADILGQLANVLPRFADGTTTAVQHTRYARLYHECYRAALAETFPPVDGRSEHFIITRTGGIYDQKNGTAIWPGDLDSGFERSGDDKNGELAVGGIPAAVAGFLSLQMSGYPLYGTDVGGYRGGAPTPEAFVRWAQAGALSTIMQVGGGGNHAPWDAELVDVIDAFTVAARLHMDLVPMWDEWIGRATREGTPVAVPVGVLGDSADAWADDMTYVLGDILLAAPVVEDGARTRTLFVPEGRWRSWWDAALVTGPAQTTVDAPLLRVPLFLREDAIVVLSDPRIETLLDNGDEAGGLDDMGARRVVRAFAGATGVAVAQATVGDIIASRSFDSAGGARAGTATLEVFVDAPRPLVADLWIADGAAANARVDGTEALVLDEAALLACAPTATCLFIETTRVRAAATARSLTLTVDVEP
jgi:alpha-D-xyloside xylohydrolase